MGRQQTAGEFAALIASRPFDLSTVIAYFSLEVLLGLIAITTSGTLLFIIARSSRLRSEKLFTLVAAQAVPDLIFGLFIVVEHSVALASGYPDAALSSDSHRALEICKDIGFFVDFNLLVSLFTYVLVAFDRWRNLVPRQPPGKWARRIRWWRENNDDACPAPSSHHRRWRNKLSRRAFLQLCAALYVVALVFTLAIRFAPGMGMGVGPSGLYCHADFNSATTCFFLGACVVLPMMLVAVLYWRLFRYVAEMSARASTSSHHELQKKQQMQKAVVARRMVAIVVFFVLCWSPAAVMIIARTIDALSQGNGEPLASSPAMDLAVAVCCTFQTAFSAVLSIALFPPLRKELWSTSVGRRVMSCCLCLSGRMERVALFASDVPLADNIYSPHDIHNTINPMDMMMRTSDDDFRNEDLHAAVDNNAL